MRAASAKGVRNLAALRGGFSARQQLAAAVDKAQYWRRVMADCQSEDGKAFLTACWIASKSDTDRFGDLRVAFGLIDRAGNTRTKRRAIDASGIRRARALAPQVPQLPRSCNRQPPRRWGRGQPLPIGRAR